MASVQLLNPRADVLRKNVALSVNVNAAVSLQGVLQTNLGPRGTMKMLVGGAGTIKITKDGNVLLQEMQIQHPTAALIARAATAQDAATGDGTTTSVVLTGELMKLLARYQESIHPRILCDGLDMARKEALNFLGQYARPVPAQMLVSDRDFCRSIARSSLATKVDTKLTNMLTDIVVDALACIAAPVMPSPASVPTAETTALFAGSSEEKIDKEEALPLDLHMVEILSMKQGTQRETRLVRGMVMDHGTRHPDMPKRLTNCFILTCNVSLEYEKSEVNSGFFYSSAEERERLALAERKFTDDKVKKLIELKQSVCVDDSQHFVVLNQKGIDPPSLDMLAKEGIMALRRVKRRNMERLILCCGGHAVNSFDDMSLEDLGYAGLVWETSIGDDKFTFVEEVRNPRSCAILIKGPSEHAIAQIKDAIRDGLRAVKNAVEDDKVVPGAGAFELACSQHLREYAKTVAGKKKMAVIALAEALMVIPKALAKNSGYDSEDVVLKMEDVFISKGDKNLDVGIDIETGETLTPSVEGIWDTFRTKSQCIHLVCVLVSQLLLVDDIMRAGRQMQRG